MALVRSPLGKNPLRFSNKTSGSSFLNIDYRNAVLFLSLSKDFRSGNVPTDQNNYFGVFNSGPPSREVTAGLQPACYATSPLFPRSSRLKCRVKPTLSRMSWVEIKTPGEHCVLGHTGGPGPVLCVRSYSGNNNSTPLHKTKTGYYDVLEVATSATHAQIKTAYYKQSFRYHPDKNAGSEVASRRFSDISEAYNVLGNKALKRKYDRGILSPGDLVGSPRPSAKEASSSATKQPPTGRQSIMGVDSQKIFDFDKFIKAHYGGQLQKQRDVQVRKEEMMRKKEADMRELKFDKILEMSVGLLVIFAVTIFFSLKKGN